MEIFTVENNRVVPSVHVLMIEPFKTTWDEDTSHNKQDSISMFSYVEFLCSLSPSNPFFEADGGKKEEMIRLELWGDTKFKHPKETRLIGLVSKYQQLLDQMSFNYSMYESAMNAAYRMKEFLDTLDPTETNKKTGNPLYKPKDITTAIKDIPETMTSLKKLKNEVLAELRDSNKSRTTKDRDVGDYER